MTVIDPRLVKLYNEYLKNDKEEEFIDMLYAILDMVDVDTRKRVYYGRAAQKRKAMYAERKLLRQKVEAYFAAMSEEELIEFQNTPWDQIPEWLREALPKLVMYPEENNFVRIYGLVGEKERQKEITGSRIVRYMEKNGFITSDEDGTHLHYDRFAEVCNEFAEKFDLPWRPGKKAQRTRITKRDLKNYTQCRVTPKHDKMAVLATATGLPLWYLGGYRDNTPPNSDGGSPLEPAPFTEGKFRKSIKKRA